ncbi:MAG: ribosomal-processing cysteine protease Prp [Oscillibacter sp.]|nr:ribosomal-processing cysteine protease Prp [Oscillibacter sp.]MCI8847709.1 ribosomal-processing cysteine protease Prp [Oscillibacter sp.]
MTRVTFYTDGARITGFDAAGHSGYAAAGEDILCASVSAAVTLVEATVNDVLGLAAAVKVDEAAASVSLRLPGGLDEVSETASQSLLTGLMLYFTTLHDSFPENIEVLEADVP